MAKNDDTFGFEDLQKAFNRIEQKYPNKVDALLHSLAKVGANRVKKHTPVGKTKKLRTTWRAKKAKKYGKARVARVQSTSRYAHLVENGHEIVTGGKGSKNGKKLNVVQRGIRGVKSGGRTEGAGMIKKSMDELESTFDKSVKDLLDELTKEVET